MSFAEMLRTLRTKAGWTQEELADKSGVPLWTLRSYEIGRREPSWRGFLDLCKGLGVDPHVFDPCVPGEPTTTHLGRPRKSDAPEEKANSGAKRSKPRRK